MISAKLEESKEGGLDANQEIDLELRMARFEVREGFVDIVKVAKMIILPFVRK